MTSPSPTEPEILAFQEKVDAFYPPDAVSAPVARQRQWYDALCRAFDVERPEGLSVADGVPAGGVAVRRYVPGAIRAPARVLYLHGGGFVVGSLDSHDGVCAELAAATGLEVVACDYRLAPEHKAPAAFKDAATVFRSLLEEGRPVVVAGDSAGGNLAAGLALLARDEGLRGVVGQVLIYPGLGGDLARGSYVEMAEAPGLTTADVAYYRDVYAAQADDIYAYPLRARDLSGLPPAFVCTAHFDPLRDDARLYAARLAEAGIGVTFREDPQMVHGWLRARHTSPGARAGFAAICQALARLASPA
ncbi:alpha/beta hydrolase [Lutibaculum baratangense]|uniref:Esterase/lipase n=1 Tax=Lutibaculum baratangense AMV1 TaxID=631454 RepID=V4R4U5_9HYPH|nr:alpha/beta hydrolase [Lutibaculum baratangense]ESR26962.1 Esterase/lipase [Lutibaculum baratangense AMV1]